MAALQPEFITFSLSHYCERARWALDWHDIAYREVGWPPGAHMLLAKLAGAKRGSVPMLRIGGELIEGSGQIVGWADENSNRVDGRKLGADPEVETRLDKGCGVNARRLIYSHVLPDHPELVKPHLFANASWGTRLLGTMMWPVTQKKIVAGYRTGKDGARESVALLEAEFDWLEGLLEGNSYLTGKAFGGVDLTAASLLSPLALPDEMAVYREMTLPRSLMEQLEVWSGRPVLEWVRKMYREHRDWRG